MATARQVDKVFALIVLTCITVGAALVFGLKAVPLALGITLLVQERWR